MTLSHITSVYCTCHLLDITYVKTVLAKYKPYVVIQLPCCFQFLKQIIVIFYNWLEAVTTITIGMCENVLDNCDTVTNGMLWSLDICDNTVENLKMMLFCWVWKCVRHVSLTFKILYQKPKDFEEKEKCCKAMNIILETFTEWYQTTCISTKVHWILTNNVYRMFLSNILEIS